MVEDFGEVRREKVFVRFGEDLDEVDAVFSDRRFVGGGCGVNGGEEDREGGCVEALSDGVELGDGDGVSVAVGEFCEGGEDFLFEVLVVWRSHCVVERRGVWSGGGFFLEEWIFRRHGGRRYGRGERVCWRLMKMKRKKFV